MFVSKAQYFKYSKVEEKETKPKPRYTEATLIEDMTRIARYVDDPYIKKLLLEKDKDDDALNGSIGTDATRYNIQKNAAKGLFCKTTITPEMATALMNGEHLKVTSLYVEKTKQKFSGTIYLDDTELSDYGPAIKIERDVVGRCPRCGGIVSETLFNYQCENSEAGCRYHIQKKSQKGLMCKTEITPAMAKKLILGEHLDITTLYSAKKSKTFSGRIYLDDAERSDYGPAIKLDPFV